MYSSRSAGSSRWVGSGAIIADTLLPKVPRSSSVRTETGIIPSSGSSGSSSLKVRCSLTAPATRQITTSLTLTPKAFLTAFTSSSETEPRPNTRCGERGAPYGPFGALTGGLSITCSSSAPKRIRTLDITRLIRRLPGRPKAATAMSTCGTTVASRSAMLSGARGIPLAHIISRSRPSGGDRSGSSSGFPASRGSGVMS